MLKKFHIIPLPALVLAALLLSGCATVSNKKIGRENWVANMATSPLTTGDLSYLTRQFLVDNALVDDFGKRPDEVILNLARHVEKHGNNANIVTDYNDLRPVINVLIELCMYQGLHGSEKDSIKYWTACNFYSYRLLYDKDLKPDAATFDNLSEVVALRYYNISCSEIFSYLFKNKIPFSKESELPAILGKVRLDGMISNLCWEPDSFNDFIVAYDYLPEGLNSHSFNSGLGVPLVAVHDKDFNPADDKEMAVIHRAYPVTYLIRYGSFLFDKGSVSAKSEFYDDFKTEDIDVDGVKTPIAKDFSVMMAAFLSGKSYIRSGVAAMINSHRMGDLEGMYMFSPYDENKIPVVLVHGLMSAPRTWVQVVNTLLSSKEIREHYQFWLYAYPTGEPFSFSASKLRADLLSMEKKYDPSGSNPNFDRMVIIGHSMGGLLTRLMISDSQGYGLLKILLHKDYDKFDFTKDEREFIENIFVFKPLPFVKRVIFVATPHKGSGMARWSISRFGSYLITLPGRFTDRSKTILIKLSKYYHDSDFKTIKVATSIDNLDPDSPMITAMNELPISPSVKINSIIGDQDGDGANDSTDGIVPYSSSHLDKAESELIVKSGHNVQTTPECAREIKRILIENLK